MLINVHNLVKRYGNLLALNHFHLRVEKGRSWVCSTERLGEDQRY